MTVTSWVLLGAVVVSALGSWHSRYWEVPWLERITKPLTTALIVAMAAIIPATYPAVRWWVVVGLVACLVGDVLLMPAIDRFEGGLGAFLVGHLLFGVAALRRSHSAWAWAAVALVALLAVGWLFGRSIIGGARGKDPKLGGAVTAYLVVISTMAVLVALTGSWLAVIGAVFFVASDTLLGYNMFVRPVSAAKVGIMATYHVALIALSLGLLRA
jgi:alkenylglycerophosphocholine hydrolase